MGRYCENCGTKWSDGCCPNCHEELTIEIRQGEFIEHRSHDWNATVNEQIEDARRRLSNTVISEGRRR